MPTVPYVTAAEFAAHPTYLDLDDLRIDVPDEAAQIGELNNLLLMGSAWANGQCNQSLFAHQVTQKGRVRVDRDGNLQLVADNFPVLAVTSVQYGTSLGSLSPVADLSTWWVEKDRLVLIPLAGAAPRTSTLYVTWTYVAGFACTVLAADSTAHASSLTVADPTGILPGDTYRLWEPGTEEFVTVSPSYVPPAVTAPPTPTAVPLAAPTLYAHTTGAGWSGMTADMRLAVTNYTVSQLMRPDTAAEDSYPDTQLSSGTRQRDARKDGSGLVAEAVRLLNPYARRS